MTELPGLRLLAVDDDEAMRELIPRRFKRVGIEAATVETPEEAVEKLETQEFDVVLIDGLHGRWTEVASTAQGLGVAAIVFSSSPELVEAAIEAGFEGLDKTGLSLPWMQALVERFNVPGAPTGA